MLRKSPILTVAAVLSLGLGIGANTTLFTLVHGVFVQPLAVPGLDRLVSFYTLQENQESAIPRIAFPNYEDVVAGSSAFEETAAIAFAPATLLSPEGEPESVDGQAVTSGFFRLLGVPPAMGRAILPEEDDLPLAHPVLVLNHRFWSTRLGSDPDVLGSTLDLDGRPFTVVGIMPPSFDGTLMTIQPDFWTPLSMRDHFVPENQRVWLENRRAMVTRAYGRLAPGVTVEQARSQVRATWQGLVEEFPDANGDRQVDLVPLAQAVLDPEQREGFARAASLLAMVVGLVLLVACGNVANLLLGRAANRRREIAIRLAMGAPRSRLIRQLLTESTLLALLAGAFGLLFAVWAKSAVWALRPAELAELHADLSLRPEVFAFTLGLSLLTGLLFGLAPALQASRPELLDDLKQESGRAPEQGGGLLSLRSLLVIGQVALCLAALVFSGLALRGLGRAGDVNLGFDPEGLAAFRLELGRRGYTPAQSEQLYDSILERAAVLPGVESATLALGLPLGEGAQWRTVLVEGRDPKAPNNAVLTPVNLVEPGYFRTLGTPLVRGRDLSLRDDPDGLHVAVINRAAASALWEGEEAVGRRFRLFGADAVWEVVGVVADSKLVEVGEEPQPQIFLSRRQTPHPDLWVVVRSGADPEAALATLQGEIRLLDSTLPVTGAGTLGERVRDSLGRARAGTFLLGLLGSLTLLLAAVGVYGVTSYSVQQRRREIGIRVAVGASRGDVIRAVLADGVKLLLVGLAAGMVLALPGARLLRGLLYGLSPGDPATYATTALVLAVVAISANLVPALRASGLDPVQVLRNER